MKKRTKIFLFCAFPFLLFIVVPVIYLFSIPDGSKLVGQTRADLRKEGFKVDLAEFNFSAPLEAQTRVAPLTNFGRTRTFAGSSEIVRRHSVQQMIGDFLPMISPQSAMVLWTQKQLKLENGAANQLQPDERWLADDAWPLLRVAHESESDFLNPAAHAAISGPIRFHLDARRGAGLLLPHLSALKNYENAFSAAMLIELHEAHKSLAWTNLLAATRLVTAWTPEPTEISTLVRFACTAIAFKTLWQALAADWSDEQLASLQREWEAVDFFKDLPETIAFTRASSAATVQQERAERSQSPIPFPQLLTSPRDLWFSFQAYREELRFRRHGTFDLERSILLHYRDRELEFRRALDASSWTEMRELPGIANPPLFTSSHRSGAVALMNNRQLTLGWQLYASPGGGRTISGRAADAESRRRIIVTAIALERYRLAQREYPDSLARLVPNFVKTAPTDFMDGQPLRYRKNADGRYLLYSVGLDCTDQGGAGRVPTRRIQRGFEPMPDGAGRTENDIVWPMRATDFEITGQRESQNFEFNQRAREHADNQAEWHWRSSAARQSRAQKTTANLRVSLHEPTLNNKPLREILKSPSAPTPKSISELMSLKAITTGREPETVTFELPIHYESLCQHATISLVVDSVHDPDSGPDSMATEITAAAAPNGNTLLIWSALYEAPGPHTLQIALDLTDAESFDGGYAKNSETILGPTTTVTNSNLLQLAPPFDSPSTPNNITIRAHAAEPNAHCRAQFFSRKGNLLKTIETSTADHLITIDWNLKTESGEDWPLTFRTTLQVTLPQYNRTQTVRLP